MGILTASKRVRHVRTDWSAACLLVSLLSLGCGGEAKPAAEPAPPPAAPAPKAPPAAKEPAPAKPVELTDVASDPSFQLSLKPAGPYKAGALGNFVVDLEPRGKYHVNQEFPMSVHVRAPDGLTLPKAELAKGDAAEFGEKGARFEVPFTAIKGEHRVEAHVRFAVCTPETCVPDERTLALALPVE